MSWREHYCGDGSMAEPIGITLFCEDRGHEQFVRALVGRLAAEEDRVVHLEVRNASGGHPQAMAELEAWQRAVAKGAVNAATDLLVVVVDANCQGWSAARDGLRSSINTAVFPRQVLGCPDPHIERWCLADPQTFDEVIGAPAPADPDKCERDFYKKLLRRAITDAGQPILIDEMDFAPELVDAMHLFRAGKNQASLKHFVDDLRGALRSIP